MSTKSEPTSNLFRICRKEQHLSIEKVSELTDYLSTARIQRIESETFCIRPDEAICLARCYRRPELLNYYCSELCAIGQMLAPKVSSPDISNIHINLISATDRLSNFNSRIIQSLNSTNDKVTEEIAELYIQLLKTLHELSECEISLSIWLYKNMQQ